MRDLNFFENDTISTNWRVSHVGHAEIKIGNIDIGCDYEKQHDEAIRLTFLKVGEFKLAYPDSDDYRLVQLLKELISDRL